MTRARPRLGILLSGRGSNFLALHAAVERGDLPAEIAVVISNKRDAPGLQRAREMGLFALAVQGEDGLVAALGAARVDWICLAGYMKLLSPRVVAAWPRRIVNIHPSLLPAFPGLHAQRQALEHGVKISGCTVHLVDEGLDSGPIAGQRAVPVLDGDSEETLSARILEQEHELYPEILRRLLTEPWTVLGRKLIFGANSLM